mmetsp:Transcript_65526/g.175685  ORF Transcript_65526/g.175685 Transcript_65526/m.175685 type:complete len:166 (-) Transcript_65526:221-718(-)
MGIRLRRIAQATLKRGGGLPLLSVSSVDGPEALQEPWARLKSVSRSVEKIGRSYAQNASRLLDVCRDSIVFKEGKMLLACLQTMAQDPHVQLMRIKNRMDPGDDGKGSAGYRDVAVNLCVVTEEARRLGVEGHVCEVLLLLESFARIKNDEGHQRYVQFRNLRGE